MSALVAPNRKVGGYLFAGLVILGELFEAPKMITDWPGFLIFWRVVADVIMISTALKVAASSKDLKVEA